MFPNERRELIATQSKIAVQLGTLIKRLDGSIADGFTSGTNRGTSESIRKALELSMTSAPAANAAGISSLDRVAPAEKNATSMPLKEFVVASSIAIS